MTTVINNPGETKDASATSAGSGVVIGAVLVLLVLVVVIVLSLPYFRGQIYNMTHQGNPTINVTLPTPTQPTVTTSKP